MITNWNKEVMMVPISNKRIIIADSGKKIEKIFNVSFSPFYFRTYLKKEIGLQARAGISDPSATDTYAALKYLRGRGLDVHDIRFIKLMGQTHVFEIFIEASQS